MNDTTSRAIRNARTVASLSVALAFTFGAAGAAFAADKIELPRSLSMSAYDTGSSGFNMTVAIGKMMKERVGTDLRVLPGGNDVARLSPLKTGRAQASAMGVGGYFAQEGVFEFASPDWGPQPLQLILASTSCNGLSVGVAKDANVSTWPEFKGKRLGFVVGSPALNQNALALLAFGGLKKEDVTIVEFSNYGAMWKGMVNNEVDGAFASTISGQAREMDASPRGLMWPPTPADDKAAWERMNAIGPYFYPQKVTCGAGGLSKDNPQVLPAYPYPIFMAYASQPESVIHGIATAMIRHYDDYKDGAPGADGLAIDRQNLQWVMPYHPGTVKAFKEAGVWTDAAQKHNDMLLKRQQVLATAWKEFTGGSVPAEAEAFKTAWSQKRAASLKAAGMDPVFE